MDPHKVADWLIERISCFGKIIIIGLELILSLVVAFVLTCILIEIFLLVFVVGAFFSELMVFRIGVFEQWSVDVNGCSFERTSLHVA